jgi:hypothetical protein
VGLNGLSEYYGDSFKPLQGAENDAAAMQAIAREHRFERCLLLLGKEATLERVMAEIRAASETLDDGDLFLLSFAGHGSEISPRWIQSLVPRPRAVEPNEWVQTWLLWERELLDKELRLVWARFKAGVRVLVVLDSCHSYSAWKTMVNLALEGSADAPESAGVPRALSEDAQEVILEEDRAYYAAKLNAALCEDDAKRQTAAKFLFLTACEDKKLAMDGKPNGVFTGALLSALKDQAWDSYTTLLPAVVERVLAHAPGQTPHLTPYPGDTTFASDPPFTITPS